MRPSDPGYYSAGRVPVLDWPAQDPAPEVRSTDPRPADAPKEPRAVTLLVRAAERAGWSVRVGYSRGRARAQQRGAYKRVETFGVWGLHPRTGLRWCAMYEMSPDLEGGWGWKRTAIWTPFATSVAPGLGSRFVDANVTDLKEWLQVEGSVGPAWYKAVHARVQEQRERQKAQAKARGPAKKKPKEDHA